MVTPNLTATRLELILTEKKISHWFSKIHLFPQKWEFSEQEFLALNICLLQRKKKKVYSIHQKFRDKQNSQQHLVLPNKSMLPPHRKLRVLKQNHGTVRGRTDKEPRFLKSSVRNDRTHIFLGLSFLTCEERELIHSASIWKAVTGCLAPGLDSMISQVPFSSEKLTILRVTLNRGSFGSDLKIWLET